MTPENKSGSFLPLAATLAVVAMLVALGTWQLQRLKWKEGLIAQISAALQAPPVELASTAGPLPTENYRRVRVRGTLLHAYEILLGPRSRGDAEGFDLVTPLRLADGSLLIVDRGWVPRTGKDPDRRKGLHPEGEVALEGLLRPAEKGNMFTPANRPELGEWYRLDPSEIAASAKIGPVPPDFLEITGQPGATYPLPALPRVDLPNDHLQYALTWYGLAAAALVIYLLARRKRARQAG